MPDNVKLGSGSLGSSSGSGSNVGAIVGGVIGGIAVIGIGVIAFILWRKHKQRQAEDGEKVEIIDEPHRPSLQPFYYELNQNPTSDRKSVV